MINGSHYTNTQYVDRTNNREAVVGHGGSTTIDFGHNATSYSVNAAGCTKDHLYHALSNDPPMTPAYKYIGEQTVGTEKCDVFGEEDQWSHHAIYFKHGSWETVQIVDKEAEARGMLKGTTHYSNCVEGTKESLFQLPARCF